MPRVQLGMEYVTFVSLQLRNEKCIHCSSQVLVMRGCDYRMLNLILDLLPSSPLSVFMSDFGCSSTPLKTLGLIQYNQTLYSHCREKVSCGKDDL